MLNFVLRHSVLCRVGNAMALMALVSMSLCAQVKAEGEECPHAHFVCVRRLQQHERFLGWKPKD